MADVGDVEFANLNEQDAAFNVIGADLLATMELVYGEALDPALASLLKAEDNEARHKNIEEATISSNPVEAPNIESSTVNEDLPSAKSDLVPQEEPKNMDVNATSTTLNSEATSPAKNVIDPSAGSTSGNIVDENSRSQSPKAVEPISSKRNARKASQRVEGRQVVERPLKKAKSLADLTLEQLDALMERAQMPEYLIEGDTESAYDAKNSTMESFPDPRSKKKTTANIFDAQNTSENIASKSIEISQVESETLVTEKKSDVSWPRRSREGGDYICLTCKAADRAPWRFKHKHLIASHVRRHQYHPPYHIGVYKNSSGEEDQNDNTNLTLASSQPVVSTTDMPRQSTTHVTVSKIEPTSAGASFNVATCSEAESSERAAQVEQMKDEGIDNEIKSIGIVEEAKNGNNSLQGDRPRRGARPKFTHRNTRKMNAVKKNDEDVEVKSDEKEDKNTNTQVTGARQKFVNRIGSDNTNLTLASSQPVVSTTDMPRQSTTHVTVSKIETTSAGASFNVATCSEAESSERAAQVEQMKDEGIDNETKSIGIVEEAKNGNNSLQGDRPRRGARPKFTHRNTRNMKAVKKNDEDVEVKSDEKDDKNTNTQVTGAHQKFVIRIGSSPNNNSSNDDVDVNGHQEEDQSEEDDNKNNNIKVSGARSKKLNRRLRTSTNNNEDINGHEAQDKDDGANQKSTETAPNEKSPSRKNPNLPNQSIVKAMKETLKALKKTQRQWANETNMSEVELSKYFNDYYNPSEWTSFEETLKTWLKNNAPASIAKKYNKSVFKVESGSTAPSQRSVTNVTNINTKDGIDDQTTPKMMANGVMASSSMDKNHVVHNNGSSSPNHELLTQNSGLVGTNDKPEVPLNYGESLVLGLLKDLGKVKASASLSTKDRLAITENVRNVKNYLHGTMTSRPTASE